jgi:hypothetical protein
MTTTVTIRGETYPTTKAAAIAMGVNTPAITKARAKGRLDGVGLGRKGVAAQIYDAQLDAEHILENIMHRKNWTVDVRDELQSHLKSTARKLRLKK